MHCLEVIIKRNATAGDPPPPPFELRYNPRIVELSRLVAGLPVSPEYKRALRHNLRQNAAWYVAYVEPPHGEGWDAFEALQQGTLADWVADSMLALCN